MFDTSIEPIPSVSTRTRSPWKPRRIGREALGPNELAVTPGWCASVSPIVGFTDRVSSAPLTIDVPDRTSASLCSLDRKSDGLGKRVSGRVGLVGSRYIQKKKIHS